MSWPPRAQAIQTLYPAKAAAAQASGNPLDYPAFFIPGVAARHAHVDITQSSKFRCPTQLCDKVYRSAGYLVHPLTYACCAPAVELVDVLARRWAK